MAGRSQRRTFGWESNQTGTSPSNVSIDASSSHIDQVSPSSTSASRNIRPSYQNEGGELRPRRSSISMRINSVRQYGGSNSIENFARSFHRAAAFHDDLSPVRRGSFVDDSDSDEVHGDVERASVPHKSLLRQQFESAALRFPSQAAIDEESTDDPAVREGSKPVDGRMPNENTALSFAPHLGSPLGRSYGTVYGSFSTRASETAKHRASMLFQERQERATLAEPDKEREPLEVRQVQQEDGTRVDVVVGQSTLPQTVFNSVNVLIGIGLLSIPLGIKYSGWLIGISFLVLSMITTSYTATILAKCLDVDSSLVTYADIAYISFGEKARVVMGILFSVELIASCVALVICFGDSLDALLPGWTPLEWKIVCGIILFPLNFLPLRLLSISSILGIMCCTGLVTIVFVDGLIKPHTPGSLREPASTYLFPAHWSTVPLSFGLLMSLWGGHSILPNIYRDMRHPEKYVQGVRYTYAFSFSLDLTMGVIGILMFGEGTMTEITSNILLTEGYPRFLSILAVVMIAIIPLTKVPLMCRPIVSTIEILTGIDARVVAPGSRMKDIPKWTRQMLSYLVKILVLVVIVLIAIAFPSFDSIMALMGSALCFTICVVFPMAFYLKIYGNELSFKERMLAWFLIILGSIFAIVGTIWACLPKEMIGAD